MSAQSTRRRPARPDCPVQQYAPAPGYPPLPAEDRRQCHHSLSIPENGRIPPSPVAPSVPVTGSTAMTVSPPGKHGPPGRLPPAMYSYPFQPAFREHQAVPAVVVTERLAAPNLAPERAKENPRIGGLQKQRFIE